MNEFKIISDRFKIEREYDYNIVYNNLISSIIDMFEFTGFPDSVRPDMLIRYLFSNGMCAIPLTVDEPPVCIATLGGKVNEYGYGTHVIATTQNGKSYRGEIGKEFAVFKNNTYMFPEFYILQTAKMLTELYTSLKCNIINARLAPVGKAKNDAQKTQIETAFENIYKGKPYTVRNANLFTEGESLFEYPTDAKNSTYLPYLSQLEDDILQKFYYHYGLNLNNVNKRAQVSAEEVTGADPLVWTIPLQKLGELKKGVEMMRTKYPDADVDFGGVWKKEYDLYMKAGVNDEKNSDANDRGDNDSATNERDSAKRDDDTGRDNSDDLGE